MIKKYRLNIMIAAMLCAALLTSCGKSASVSTESGAQGTEISEASVSAGAVTSEMINFKDSDNYTDWKNENPVYIELNGQSAQIKGSGAEYKENKVTITKAGTYVLSGTLTNGQIVVNSDDKDKVRMILNGADITSSNSSAIYVKKADKTVISLQEGTVNKITDGKEYVLEDKEADEPSAALFSKADLTINGTGSLTVQGNYKDGITSKDDLKITGGNLTIKAVDDGIVGKDEVLANAGNIIIEADGDGIKSTNDKDAQKGFIALQGGTFNIKSGADGIQAETSLLISGGDYTVVTGGGSANAVQKVNEDSRGMMGNRNFSGVPGSNTPPQGNPPQGNQAADTNGKAGNTPPASQQNNSAATAGTAEESQSAKAIKASADLTIKGGTFKIDSKDDAIHSNNSVNVEAGDLAITAGDDGIHADSALNIKGGKVNIAKSYEGIESEVITITDGEVNITSSDDGVNASNSKDQTANAAQGQKDPGASGNAKLIIQGGYVSVNASGDGLDANGSMSMSGGTVVVSGPTNDGNGALDYDSTFDMTGGLLVAAGSSGMAQAPSDESTQNSIIMSFSSAQKAGTIISLKDSSGNMVATYAPAKQFQSIVIASPDIKKNAAYTLYTGGTSTGTVTNGLYKGGEYQNGTKVVEFTVANSVTWLNESGVTTAQSNGFGGGGKGFGGGQRPQGMNKPQQ